jgi:hypothetical protein
MNRVRCRLSVSRRLVLAIVAVPALLAGCAGQPPPARNVNLSGYSAAFREGYLDGCDSARAARRRDERRYQQDADYMMGWNDGRSACSKSK